MPREFMWSEKYRPRTVEDIVLLKSLKDIFKKFVVEKNIPNLLLAGSQGIGKTTIARAMLDELGCDYIIINGSLNGNIDTLRNEIMQFASSMSLIGGRKYVILDEADYLNPTSVMPALRNFMEEYSSNCGFILTCNYKNRIIKPIHSRCSVIDFDISKADYIELAGQMFKRVCYILNEEKVEYDRKVVVEFVKKFFPDNRRIINELQFYSSSGKIDDGILAIVHNVQIKNLVQHLKIKDFNKVRKWVAENNNNDPATLFRKLYDTSIEYMKPASIPHLVLILAESQYKSAFVVDQEINMVACLTEIMVQCEWI